MIPQYRWNRYFTNFLRVSGPPPSHQPFYSDLMLDADHRVWIGDYLGSWAGTVVLREAGQSWTVLSLDGEVIARASFPASVYRQRLNPVLDIRHERITSGSLTRANVRVQVHRDSLQGNPE